MVIDISERGNLGGGLGLMRWAAAIRIADIELGDRLGMESSGVAGLLSEGGGLLVGGGLLLVKNAQEAFSLV